MAGNFGQVALPVKCPVSIAPQIFQQETTLERVFDGGAQPFVGLLAAGQFSSGHSYHGLQ